MPVQIKVGQHIQTFLVNFTININYCGIAGAETIVKLLLIM